MTATVFAIGLMILAAVLALCYLWNRIDLKTRKHR